MEITKVEEISTKLAEAVLKAEPGTPEFERAVKANDEWIKTLSDIQRAEDEIRIKQNVADDQLVAKRDEDAFKAQQAKERRIIDLAGLGISAVGTLTMVWVSVKTVLAELDEKPFFGLAEKIASNSMRFMIKR